MDTGRARLSPIVVTIAADGSLYFMRPLADTGRFHIYRSASRNGQFAQPELVPFSAPDNFGDVDPVVAPDESFLIFSSTRPPTPNVEARLSPDLRTPYFSSSYTPPITYPNDRENSRNILEQSQWYNGNTNIWYVPIDNLIRN